MEFALMLQQLWRLRVLVAFGVLLAAVVAVIVGYRVQFSPLSVRERSGDFGAAQTVIYVDAPRPALVTGGTTNTFGSLTAKAQLLARLLGSDGVKRRAAKALSTRATDITVEGPFPDQPAAQNVQPVAQQRANRLLSQGGRYSVFVDTEANVPTITLFLQAPTGRAAVRLGTAMVDSLRAYVNRLAQRARPAELVRLRDEILVEESERNRDLPPAARRERQRELLDSRVTIRTTGPPVGGDVRDQTGRLVVVLVFAAAVIGWCVLLLLLSGFVRAVRPQPRR